MTRAAGCGAGRGDRRGIGGRRRAAPLSRVGVALGILLALAAGAQEGSDLADEEWLRAPTVDLSALEEPVARQLEDLQELLAARIADPEATAADLGEAFGELARHYHAYQLSEAAAKSYAIARRLAPGDFRWTYLAGYLLQSEGRLEQAAELYERALGIVPEVPPALVRLGQTYRELNRPDDAERVLNEALRFDPTSAAALAEIGQLYSATGRHAEAVEALEKALELVPEAELLYYPLGLAYRELGEMDRAVEALSRRGKVGVRPADPLVDGLEQLTTGERVHLLRGRAAFDARRFGEAADEFRRAVEARPESVPARINLAAALAELDQAQAAIAELEEVVRIAPGNGTAWFNLGMLLEQAGDLEGAAEHLAEAAQWEPRDSEIRLRLGDALRALGRLEEALLHYGRAVALDAGNEAAWVAEADVLARLGRFEEALTRLETGQQLMPTSGQITHGLARLLAACPDPALRDGERALDLALRVVEALPTAGHLRTLALAHAELGQCDEAAAWIARAIEGALEAGDEQTALRLQSDRTRYGEGPPCRPPGTAGD